MGDSAGGQPPQNQGSIIHSSDGSVSGEHGAQTNYPLLVGPATAKEKNTVRPSLFPIACWGLQDLRFDFGSSFVKPDSKDDFAKLKDLLQAHPKSPLSLFGHADPVGKPTHNKKLSGRRAIAVYGILIRNTGMWESLYSQPYMDDKWGMPQVLAILETLGYSPAEGDGLLKGQASDILKTFQSDNGLTSHGYLNVSTRKKLFAAYMDALCGPDFKLQKTDFLAKGADADGRGDYQGCSEFNPLIIFGDAENTEFSKSENHKQRNAVNAPNRRVMIFLFRPGAVVAPGKWPCPKADTEAIAACKKRFWSDGEQRLQNTDKRRTYSKDRNTFACRFYERLSTGSPCEQTREMWVVRLLSAGKGPLSTRQPLANEPFTLRGVGATTPIIEGRTDQNGVLRAAVSDATPTMTLAIAGTRVTLKGGILKPMSAGDDAVKQRLHNLGYGDLDFEAWTDDTYRDALKAFQHDNGLNESGTADDDTKQKLKEIHGS